MIITIHKSLPDGWILAKGMFDFVEMDLFKDKGYNLIRKSYILASPSGTFHEFLISDYTEYHSLEKYVQNKQLFIETEHKN